MLPFQPLSNALRTTITANRLTPASQVLGILSSVAYFDGPLGHLMLFKGGENFRFYLKARAVFTNAGGFGIGLANLNLASQNLKMLRTPRPAGAFPLTYHPDLLVYGDDGTGILQELSIISADFQTGDLVVSTQAIFYDIVVYFVPADGEFELRIVRPLGSDVASAKLFGGALRSIHETDQTNARSAPIFGSAGREYPLPPQFRLELAVRSNTQIVFDQYAQHEISLPMFDTPIRVLDAAQLNAQAELKLRGGTL